MGPRRLLARLGELNVNDLRSVSIYLPLFNFIIFIFKIKVQPIYLTPRRGLLLLVLVFVPTPPIAPTDPLLPSRLLWWPLRHGFANVH